MDKEGFFWRERPDVMRTRTSTDGSRRLGDRRIDQGIGSGVSRGRTRLGPIALVDTER
jgi:hypothetical protein